MNIEVEGESAYCYTNNREIDPGKDSIVFIHGAGMDHTVWTLFARHFARHGRNVIALDLPGHGRSSGEPKASIEDTADWLVAVLDKLGIQRATLVGHSLGSLVALDCAAGHPGRNAALVMVGTTTPMPVSDAILEAAAVNDHAAFDMLTEYGYSRRHLYGGSNSPGVWMVGSTLRLFERSRPGVLHADLNACNRYLQGLERAAQVSCPVLLVLGKGDRLTPVRTISGLQAALPDPQVVVLASSGHTLMSEAPNELLDALRNFLLSS